MNQNELNKILENHKHWLNKDCDGWEYMCASLAGANLSCATLANANLKDANLADANLERAFLKGADLTDANLEGANLTSANLVNAYLGGANLTNANLIGANLTDAILADANIVCADFEDTNLTEANFAVANLKCADLTDANLKGANLTNAILEDAILEDAILADANLKNADLRYAKNVPFIPLACPDTGTFTAYKRAGRYIIKLQIPEDAKRLSATGRKCRCDKAKVLEIQNPDGTLADVTKVESNFDETFIYEVGKTVSVDNFDEDRWNECSTGIHFFINRQEAVNW